MRNFLMFLSLITLLDTGCLAAERVAKLRAESNGCRNPPCAFSNTQSVGRTKQDESMLFSVYTAPEVDSKLSSTSTALRESLEAKITTLVSQVDTMSNAIDALTHRLNELEDKTSTSVPSPPAATKAAR